MPWVKDISFSGSTATFQYAAGTFDAAALEAALKGKRFKGIEVISQ